VIAKFLTVEEAAAELGVTVGRVRQMLLADGEHEAQLRGEKFGRSWAIPLDEVQKLKKIQRKPGNPNFSKKPC